MKSFCKRMRPEHLCTPSIIWRKRLWTRIGCPWSTVAQSDLGSAPSNWWTITLMRSRKLSFKVPTRFFSSDMVKRAEISQMSSFGSLNHSEVFVSCAHRPTLDNLVCNRASTSTIRTCAGLLMVWSTEPVATSEKTFIWKRYKLARRLIST